RRPTLVAIGRLAPEKRFTLLLEAFARARSQSGGSHQLLIVGEGPERRVLARRIAVLRLAGSVRLAGYVDGADRLLARAAGFVISSRTEGLPLALLEAMQWRVPILASAVGAIPELLDEGRRGTLHFDLLLAAATALAIALGGRRTTAGSSAAMDPVAKRLWILVGYILVTIPFVEWPGSVLHNLEPYAKSLCFFFFVVATVDTTRKLRMLLV